VCVCVCVCVCLFVYLWLMAYIYLPLWSCEVDVLYQADSPHARLSWVSYINVDRRKWEDGKTRAARSSLAVARVSLLPQTPRINEGVGLVHDGYLRK
jgi:hypothetical protein